MALTKDPAGKSAPSGGFQTGGGHLGYQYWDGSFASQAGQIHPSSNQPGAGGAAYVAPQDVAYIQQQNQQQPKSQEEVTPYLNQYQNQLFQTSTAPEVKISTMGELKTELAPSVPYPEPLNRVEQWETLRTTYGVADLEKSLTTLKDQITAEQDALREQRGIEEGKPVPMGVISGRITEEERVANVRLDQLGRQQARVVDELNTKYNVINQVMTLTGLDYNDAVKRYETEFDMNIKMYDLIAGARKEARSAYEYDQTAAKANLQIYANAAISGNIDYASLDPAQKLMISKLEVQSGLPVGFISSIKKDPKADILFTTSNEGITQVGFRNADGSISVQSYGTRIAGKATESEKKQTAVSDMARTLNELGGSDYLVSSDEWKEARAVWIRAGYSGEDFDSAFAKQYVDYSHYADYGVEL